MFFGGENLVTGSCVLKSVVCVEPGANIFSRNLPTHQSSYFTINEIISH